MTVLSAQSIHGRWGEADVRNNCYGETSPFDLVITPFSAEKQIAFGASYGLTCAGYDIRVGRLDTEGLLEAKRLEKGDFLLCASLEYIKVPNDLQVIVHDKSSWARKGLALQNTVLEPGWDGYITLELSNHGRESLVIHTGQPIAQLIFHQLDQPTVRPYCGKYQGQGPEPTQAIEEKVNEA